LSCPLRQRPFSRIEALNEMNRTSALHAYGTMKRRRPITGFGVGLLLVAVALVGCSRGPKLVPAGGTVKYKAKPIPGADILMMSDASGPPSIGRTDDQGRFTVTTDGKPGALVGTYRVAITAARNKREVSAGEALTMTSEQIAANREDLIPIKYNNFESSGLTATVGEKAAENEFSFELK
jgi:hypothetical protein